ncbi:Uncharacterised protein [Mycobacteroides abscessus subsp. abscessus]|nr:Uncharacterised protein [Mycobacteroides abscessus subsp. abscessus]
MVKVHLFADLLTFLQFQEFHIFSLHIGQSDPLRMCGFNRFISDIS